MGRLWIAEFEQALPCQEPYLYDWDTDGIGDMDDDLHLFYLNPGNYFITVYDSLTCRDTATITIENDFQVFIPNAITPNADGFNDNWDIRGINNFPTASILIFDIQGQVIFQHSNILMEIISHGMGRTLIINFYLLQIIIIKLF